MKIMRKMSESSRRLEKKSGRRIYFEKYRKFSSGRNYAAYKDVRNRVTPRIREDFCSVSSPGLRVSLSKSLWKKFLESRLI